MAETPKGDTASPTDAPDSVEAGHARLSDAADTGPGSGSEGTIAGDIGEDRLATAGTRPEPWSTTATERSDTVEPHPAGAAPSPAARTGGLRGPLILVILLALVIGGGYATYPMWRGEVEPYARQVGIDLPAVATAPEAANPAQSAAIAPPAESQPAEQRPPEPKSIEAKPAAQPADDTAATAREDEAQEPATTAGTDTAPNPPPTVGDPALAGEVDRLLDRVNALDNGWRHWRIRLRARQRPTPRSSTSSRRGSQK